MKTKHKHDWTQFMNEKTGKIFMIKCFSCNKISFPNKKPLKNEGCFGKIKGMREEDREIERKEKEK